VNHELQTLEFLHSALELHQDSLMTSAFNLNGTVLLDLAVQAGFHGQVVFVDTDYHFPETLTTRDNLAKRYPEVEFVTLSAGLPLDDLYKTDTATCCALRKVAPLKNYLEQHKPSALLNARSREQSSTRADIELREETPERIIYNPLAFWTQAEIEEYAILNELPVNPLYWQGYSSIGCAPCTRAIKNGEDARAGRWSGTTKTECGLWNRGGL
jgi:phosphoadenosine phosphosulfate reductase